MSEELKELKEQNAATYIKLSKDMYDKFTIMNRYQYDETQDVTSSQFIKKLNDLKNDYDESHAKFDKFVKKHHHI